MSGAALRTTVTSAALVVCALSAAAALPKPSYGGGDANGGAKIVQSSGCTGCHGARLAGAAGFPSLVGIERRKSIDQIANAIVAPRPPMPTVDLTRAQVADVVAYLVSLDGANGRPVVTFSPARPAGSTVVSVKFPGTPPADAAVKATMQMGSMSHGTGWIPLRRVSEPHTVSAKVPFSMGGPWTITVRYDGHVDDVPLDVGG